MGLEPSIKKTTLAGEKSEIGQHANLQSCVLYLLMLYGFTKLDCIVLYHILLHYNLPYYIFMLYSFTTLYSIVCLIFFSTTMFNKPRKAAEREASKNMPGAHHLSPLPGSLVYNNNSYYKYTKNNSSMQFST